MDTVTGPRPSAVGAGPGALIPEPANLGEDDERNTVHGAPETPVSGRLKGVAEVLANVWVPRHLHRYAIPLAFFKEPWRRWWMWAAGGDWVGALRKR